MGRMQLKHKTALITGAGSGIGRGLSLSLAKRNCNLIIADINTRGLDETAQLVKPHGVEVSCHQLDVADRDAVKNFAQKIQAQYQGLDVLINNAGVALWGSFEQLSEDEFDWLLNINFHGVVSMTREFLPLLHKSMDARICNISSLFGIIAPAGQTAYCASKFAVRGFSEALREELKETNIGVTVVHPGGIATQIAEKARPAESLSETEVKEEVEMSRKLLVLPPETAGEIIINGIEKRQDRVLVGNDAKLITFIQRLFPVRYNRIIDRIIGT